MKSFTTDHARRLKVVLERATTLTGKPLTPDARRKIQNMLAWPGKDTWDAAHSLIISQHRPMTVWQAYVLMDPGFPISAPEVNGQRVWHLPPDWSDNGNLSFLRDRILQGLEEATAHNQTVEA